MEDKTVILKVDGEELYKGDNHEIALIMFAGAVQTIEPALQEFDGEKDISKSVELIAKDKRIFFSAGVETINNEAE